MARFKNFNLHITDGSTDYSHNLSNFDGIETLSITTSSYIYLGFKKPIHTAYFDVENANTASNILSVEKYDGTWKVVDRLDDTNGFRESGFIYFDEFSDEALTTINNEEMYWIRISTTTIDSGAIGFRHINLMFCSEKDLLKRDSNINRMYPMDDDRNIIESHLLALMDARDTVINDINNLGRLKYNGIEVSLLNQWDFLDIDELRHITIDKALENANRNTNDSGGEFRKNAELNRKDYERGINKFRTNHLLKIDLNDDGIKDTSELASAVSTSVRLGR